jgi:hypothetical protein
MPGISGTISSGGPLTNASELMQRIERVHALPKIEWVTRSIQTEQALIINFLTGLWSNTQDQPASDPSETNLLFLEGQIFNWDEINRKVADEWAQSPCQKLLALFLEYGPDFASLLEGEFNLVIYQPVINRLLLFSDQLASKPFYYLAQPHSLLFGSEKKAILALADPLPELDPVGLIQLVAYRHHVGGRTLHKGVACLLPAAYLEYQNNQIQLARYAHLRFQLRTPTGKLTPLLEEWASLLRDSTRKRLEYTGRLLLSLSGGLDSRAIACGLFQTKGSVLARTRGDVSSAEVQAACAIAASLGFDHQLEEPSSVPLSTLLPQIVWRTEGAIPFTHGMTVAYHAQLKQQADFMAGGWFGDASSGAHLSTFMLLPYSREQFIDKVHHWYMQYHKDALQRLFQPEFLNQHLPELSSVFSDSFKPIESEENWQAFELWDLQERQTRMTFCAGPVDSHLFELFRPFLDMKYLNFALTLPPYLRYGQVMYQSMIYHFGPEIRHVPNANTGLLLKGTIKGNLLNRLIARKNRAQTRLREKIAPNHNKGTSQLHMGGLNAEIRQDAELRHRLDTFINSDYFDSSIFNRPQIQTFLDQHYQGVADHSYPISMLATLSAALPTFVYQSPRYCPPEAEPFI